MAWPYVPDCDRDGGHEVLFQSGAFRPDCTEGRQGGSTLQTELQDPSAVDQGWVWSWSGKKTSRLPHYEDDWSRFGK